MSKRDDPTRHDQKDTAQQAEATSEPRQSARSTGRAVQQGLVPTLRATLGNRIVARMVQGLQAKLSVSQPGDACELEADRTARDVVDRLHAPARERAPAPVTATADAAQVQRAPATGETSPSQVDPGLVAPPDGSGLLPRPFRARVERLMGADFSGVRVHTDTAADRLNTSLGARAVTLGPDVYFRRGEYNVSSRAGQELVVHELTHVQQQRARPSAPVLQRKIQIGDTRPTRAEIAHSIHAGRAPQHRAAILGGTFQRFQCSACRELFEVDRPFIYIDPDRREWIGVFPRADEGTWAELEEAPLRAHDLACGPAAPAVAREIGANMRIRTVFGLDALREKLVCFAAGIDDVALELVKLQLLVAGLDLPWSEERALRLIEADEQRRVFASPSARGGPDDLTLVEISRGRFDEFAELGRSAPLAQQLDAGPYVDSRRLVL